MTDIGLKDRFDRDGNSQDDHAWAFTTVLDGKRTVRKFDDRRAAFHEYHRDILAKQQDGYQFVVNGLAVHPTEPAQFASVPELEAAVEANLGDELAWERLARAWSDAGDVRGACVLADLASKAISDPAVFMQKKKASESAKRMRDWHLFGPLAHDAYRVDARLRLGLVESITLATEVAVVGRPTHELLAQVLPNPVSRFLASLTIVGEDLHASVAAIGHLGAPALRSLSLRDVLLGNLPCPLGAATRAVPRLEELSFAGPALDWTSAALPACKKLELVTIWSTEQLVSILDWIAAHPRLEQVVLSGWMGPGYSPDGAPLDLTSIEAWLDGVERWPPSLRSFEFGARKASR